MNRQGYVDSKVIKGCIAMEDEKFLNMDEMMVDYAEMTSFNFESDSYWNANMVASQDELSLQKPEKNEKKDLLDLLQNVVLKFGFHNVKA